MLATLNTTVDPFGTLTRQSVIAVLTSKIFTASSAKLYLAKFAVELWMENEDMAGIFDDFLPAGTSALEVLCRQKRSCTAFTSQQTPWVGNTLGLVST